MFWRKKKEEKNIVTYTVLRGINDDVWFETGGVLVPMRVDSIDFSDYFGTITIRLTGNIKEGQEL